MKALNLFLVALVSTTVLVSCKNKASDNKNVENDQQTEESSQNAVLVKPLEHAKEFPGASLAIAELKAVKLGEDSATITVKYKVENFNLTEQTDHTHHMANSKEGQHIHFILDNAPYVPLYVPEYNFNVAVGSEHYLLSFLSRSFHESIKTPEASELIRFKVDQNTKIEKLTTTEASLFYSRPKGEYVGEDTKSVLLDFFLLNTQLSAEGNKVKANINGNEFILDQWIPYEIQNLPYGENTIKLSLIDKDGNNVSGDNTTVERTIKLTE